MTENQKLREAFETYITDDGKWPNAILKAPGGQYLLLRTSVAWQDWKACAEALALLTVPAISDTWGISRALVTLYAYECDGATDKALALITADHIPDAGKMIETAAPVGERELPPLPSYARWEERIKMLMQQCGHPNSMSIYQAFKQFQNEFEHEMIAYARAALSAGDAGWQPIETAPKDGSDCWLLVEEEVRRGFWVEIEFEERRDLDGRYIDQTDDYAYWMDKDSGDSIEPTMFYPITKPLPPAPAMRKGQP